MLYYNHVATMPYSFYERPSQNDQELVLKGISGRNYDFQLEN